MNIDWNHVTKFSQLIAVVLFVVVFGLGFWLGEDYEYHAFLNGINTGVGLVAPPPPTPSFTPAVQRAAPTPE